MKHIHSILLTILVMAFGADAAEIMNEPFDYADGPLTTVSGGLWTRHSGTTPEQVDVTSGKLNLTRTESEDVNRAFEGGTFDSGTLYASFVVNFSETPASFGAYFAHFNSSGFKGRVFATTAEAASGKFRVGIANGTDNYVAIPTDLDLGQDYLLVVRLGVNPVASTLWINPSSEVVISHRTDATDTTPASTISAYAFRQANGIGTLTIDNLRIGTAFADVIDAGNTSTNPPVISAIDGQSIPANSSTGPISFMVNDGETAPAALVVTASSSNPTLVPNNPANLTLTGTDTDRNLEVIPAAGQQGAATINILVTDGDNNTAETSFEVVVGAPSITAIPNQFTRISTPTAAIQFTIGDNETPAGSLTLSGSSSNPSLISSGSFAFGGSGANRSVIITPVSGQSGMATVTITVSDGINTAESAFALSVNYLTGTDLVDDFSYEDGALVPNSFFTWDNHSGADNEMQVMGGKVQLSQYQSEDVNAFLFMGLNGFYSATDGSVLYASFAVRFSELPANDGSYFAHYKDDGTFNFRARVFATTNAATPGYYRLGIANGSGSASVIHPADLALEDTVIVTTRYIVGTAETVLWVNATAESDSSVAATDVVDPADVWAFALRESFGMGVLSLDNLFTGGTFADVYQIPPPPNTSPVISAIEDQTTDVNVAVAPLAFAIGDAESAADDLVLSVASTNLTLVPEANILLSGSGSNRTVTVTPATGEFGTTLITLTVTDEGERQAASSFLVVVLAANNPPYISAVPNQQTPMGMSTPPIPFEIGDLETPAENLTLSASSSDLVLVPEGNIVFGGSGSNRTVTLSPSAGLAGTATITINVEDDAYVSSSSFDLTVTLAELLVEPFDYADGSIITNSAFLWTNHSGTLGQMQVANGKLQVTQEQGEDVNALLAGGPYAETAEINLYASFTVVFNELPGQSYFAHFKNDGTGFRGKVYAGIDNAAPGKFRLGITSAASSSPVEYPMDLSLGIPYLVVARYSVASASSSLWIDPASEMDSAAESIDPGTPVSVYAYAFRQSGGIGAMEIDDLIVGTSFAVVVPNPPVRIGIMATAQGIQVSWPASAAGYELQSSDTIDTGWARHADQGQELDGQRIVTITEPAGILFFRLSKTE